MKAPRPHKDCGNLGWCGFEDKQLCERHADKFAGSVQMGQAFKGSAPIAEKPRLYPYERMLVKAADALRARDEAQDDLIADLVDLIVRLGSEHTHSLLVRAIRKEML